MTHLPHENGTEAATGRLGISTLTVPADVRYLETVCGFVSNCAKIAGMGEDDIGRLELAVDEACTNVVRHGYGDDAAQSYSVSCSVDGPFFIVDVEDRGKPFDIDAVPTPDLSMPLEERPVGGLGLYMIRKIVDEVTQYTEPDGLKRLRMKKNIRSAGGR